MAMMPICLAIEECRECGEPLHILQLDNRRIRECCLLVHVGSRRQKGGEEKGASSSASLVGNFLQRPCGPDAPMAPRSAWGEEGGRALPKCHPCGRWEVYLEHTIGHRPPLGQVERVRNRRPRSGPLGPLDNAETRETWHHTTWADDIILIATSAENITAEPMRALTKASFAVKRGKARYWSLYRPAAISVEGQRLQAEDDRERSRVQCSHD